MKLSDFKPTLKALHHLSSTYSVEQSVFAANTTFLYLLDKFSLFEHYSRLQKMVLEIVLCFIYWENLWHILLDRLLFYQSYLSRSSLLHWLISDLVNESELLLVRKTMLFYAYCEISNIFTRPIHFYKSWPMHQPVSFTLTGLNTFCPTFCPHFDL